MTIKNKIQKFSSKNEFDKREDKTINGYLVGNNFPNLINCEGCWECNNCESCVNCTYCSNCVNCTTCQFTHDSVDCKNCYDCEGYTKYGH